MQRHTYHTSNSLHSPLTKHARLAGTADRTDRLDGRSSAGTGLRRRAADWQALLERFGTPQEVLAAPPSALRDVPGVGPKLSQKIAAGDRNRRRGRDRSLPQRNRDPHPQSCGISTLAREIPDPPALLFVRGTIKPADALAIGIVGSRHGTHYGLRQAERLAGSLARAGLTIISGLARGIDAAAHRGALEAGGRTLASWPAAC